MNTFLKTIFIIIGLVVLGSIALVGLVLYHPAQPTPQLPDHNKDAINTTDLGSVLREFPTGLVIETSPTPLQIYQTAKDGAYQTVYQYYSNLPLDASMSAFKNYLTRNGWTITQLPTATSSMAQALSATKNDNTLLITATIPNADGRVVIGLNYTEPLINGFPADFPTEAGAKVTNTPAQAGANGTLYTRDYTSTKSVQAVSDMFRNYLSNNGWNVQVQTQGIMATKFNAQLNIVLTKAANGTTVDIQLTLLK